ncbi:MAG: DUF4445 domain-containing protein [Deltaproteobacteria bacterium]|nr:DUF4445 domain-containing protein [Deltaproteobacteria bacterium]
MIHVTFQPSNKTAEANPGERIMDVAVRAGVKIASDCGGRGKCGRCRVEFEAAAAEGAVSDVLGAETALLPENRDGYVYRLACLTRVLDDCIVIVPPESRVSEAAPRKPFTRYKIPIRPAVSRRTVTLESVNRKGPFLSFAARIRNALREGEANPIAGPSFPVLSEASASLKGKACPEITATLFKDTSILQIRPGVREELFGVALDLGTTSLVAFLCDLKRDRIVGVASGLNPQVSYGEDVISRIAQVQKDPSKLEIMQKALVDAVNGLIRRTAEEAGVSSDDVLDVVAVANPTMQHLFLGLNPVSLGEAPYLTVCSEAGEVEARHLNLQVFPYARVHVLPLLSGFVGSDTISALITRKPEDLRGNVLMVDVGTNGELVLSRDGILTATSCATGPVFEGAQIRCGMRAAPGAIEKFRMDENGGAIQFRVIADQETQKPPRPRGICGSGVISAVTVLLRAGIVRKDGAFDLDCGHPSLRINAATGVAEAVLVPATRTQTGRNIVITQNDIRAVQLGKAALRAGSEILMKDGGIEQLDRILLAGTFGNYLDPQEILDIGMFPPIDVDRIEPIGNAAGDGARLALFSLDKRLEAVDLADRIQVVELSMRPDFQEVFVDSIQF